MSRNHEYKSVLITPEMAKKMLEKNYKGNRSIRKNKVAEFAKDMRNGLWTEVAGGVISFGADGTLYDGQHRLLAIIESGCPQRFIVRYDATESDYKNFDCGTKRSVADAIEVRDKKDMAACGSTVFSLIEGENMHSACRMTGAPYSRRELIEFILANEDTVRLIKNRAKSTRQSIEVGSIKSYTTAFFYAYIIDEEKALDFFRDLDDSRASNGIANTARETILKAYAKSSQAAPKHWWIACTVIQAFDSFLKNKETKTLKKQEFFREQAEALFSSTDFRALGFVY